MKKVLMLILICLAMTSAFTQSIKRPKLIVGIVIDQMRYDYLYKYYDRYDDKGGFKTLLNGGFSCENTFIPYIPTVTACGHSCIYTGSVPAINGITGNIWWDNDLKRSVYCTEDSTVHTIGTNTAAGLQSPRNLLTNTIGDELKLATNFKSKVIGVALKDRGSILPAGHTGDAAYWYDGSAGKWITSDYYMKTLPDWVVAFNEKKLIDDYYKKGWQTLYPPDSYSESTKDINAYEAKPLGSNSKGFPYDLAAFAGKNYSTVLSTPFGNILTAEFAKQAVISENLGNDDITDLLAVSFSSPDYIGHAFGPNSIEVEDNYLRLDKDLGDFIRFLDDRVGKNEYLLFLSADHGVAHVPAFASEHHIPSGTLDVGSIKERLNNDLNEKMGKNNLILSIANYQINLNSDAIKFDDNKMAEVKKLIIDYLSKEPGIERVIDLENLGGATLNEKVKMMISNGYNPHRSGQLQIILQPQWMENYGNTGTTHGNWNPYDSHIPLLWYGWGIGKGQSNREVYMTDIAPTIAGLLHIQMPNGSVGHVISEVAK